MNKTKKFKSNEMIIRLSIVAVVLLFICVFAIKDSKAQSTSDEFSKIHVQLRNRVEDFTITTDKSVKVVWEDYKKVISEKNDVKYNVEKATMRQVDNGIQFKVTYLVNKSDKIELDKYVKEVSKKLRGMSARDKIVTIHNTILRDAEYGEDTVYKSAHSPMSIVYEGKGVCQAYALLAYEILQHEQVPTQIVTGELNGIAHMWLKVKLDDTWYNIDFVNNDIPDGGIHYNYFLTTDYVLEEYNYESNRFQPSYDNRYTFLEEAEFGDFYGGKFYFVSKRDGRMYVADWDGNKTEISNEEITSLAVSRDTLYYVNYDGSLKSIDLIKNELNNIGSGVSKVYKASDTIRVAYEGGNDKTIQGYITTSGEDLAVRTLFIGYKTDLPAKSGNYDLEWYISQGYGAVIENNKLNIIAKGEAIIAVRVKDKGKVIDDYNVQIILTK